MKRASSTKLALATSVKLGCYNEKNKLTSVVCQQLISYVTWILTARRHFLREGLTRQWPCMPWRQVCAAISHSWFRFWSPWHFKKHWIHSVRRPWIWCPRWLRTPWRLRRGVSAGDLDLLVSDSNFGCLIWVKAFFGAGKARQLGGIASTPGAPSCFNMWYFFYTCLKQLLVNSSWLIFCLHLLCRTWGCSLEPLACFNLCLLDLLLTSWPALCVNNWSPMSLGF